MTTTYTETYSLDNSFAIADLGMSGDMDALLREVLNGDDAVEIRFEIEQAITAKLREHGVDAETGEWFGEWSAEQIVRDILLARYAR